MFTETILTAYGLSDKGGTTVTQTKEMRFFGILLYRCVEVR
jgi:hypothetical protein